MRMSKIHLNRGSSLNHGTIIHLYYNSLIKYGFEIKGGFIKNNTISFFWYQSAIKMSKHNRFITYNNIFCKQGFNRLCPASKFAQNLKDDHNWII